jgi:hypothetical protein
MKSASTYVNHYKMKQSRLIKLKQAEGKCEACGKKGSMIHHIDFTNYNHDIKNLILLCNNCHKVIHFDHDETAILKFSQNYQIGQYKTSKLRRIYKVNPRDVMKKLGINYAQLYTLHIKNRLTGILNEIKRKEKSKKRKCDNK